MTVTLTEEQERFISDQLKTGHYRSAEDIIARSLAMLQAQEDFISSHRLELREKIAEGLDDVRQGKTADGPKLIRKLRRNLGLPPRRQ